MAKEFREKTENSIVELFEQAADYQIKTYDEMKDKLKAIHLNDSKNERGSHKDRHEKIGLGHIGWDAMTHIINHPRLRTLPFYLETPNDLEGYADEISRLRQAFQEVD